MSWSEYGYGTISVDKALARERDDGIQNGPTDSGSCAYDCATYKSGLEDVGCAICQPNGRW